MSLFFESFKSYETLASDYGNFLTPSVKLSVGNTVVSLIVSGLLFNTGMGIVTDGVSVTLNRDAASSAEFNIVNCYNQTAKSFVDKLSVGERVVIRMGYGSKLKVVFSGFVETLSYEFGDNPSIKVTAMDAVKLLMDTKKTERIWKNGGMYINDFIEIMSVYSDICPVPITNIVPTTKTHAMLKQNSNDYEYIKKSLCKYCDRDFIVSGGVGHFFNPHSPVAQITSLSYGKGLTHFSVKPSYKKVKVIVTGDRLRGVRAESNVMTGFTYKKALDKPQEIIAADMPFLTSSDCKLYADRIAFDEIRDAQNASGECIGLPELMPGRTIGIKDVDPRWNTKTFCLERVKHTIGSGGYTTSFDIKGWM